MERNLEYLNRHRIIYRRLPITDIPDEEFEWGWYYRQGTHECYTLFTSKAKINTFKSLKWHLLVLWYLNPQLGVDDFQALAEVISNKKHGFVTFDLSKTNLDRIIHDVSMMDLEEPPKNKVRKVIFRYGCGLSINEKLGIVGKLVGRTKKIDTGDVYECMIGLHHEGSKITTRRISEILQVSTRTVHRYMCEDLKREKELLNRELIEE
jgi:hypothetical protein